MTQSKSGIYRARCYLAAACAVLGTTATTVVLLYYLAAIPMPDPPPNSAWTGDFVSFSVTFTDWIITSAVVTVRAFLNPPIIPWAGEIMGSVATAWIVSYALYASALLLPFFTGLWVAEMVIPRAELEQPDAERDRQRCH